MNRPSWTTLCIATLVLCLGLASCRQESSGSAARAALLKAEKETAGKLADLDDRLKGLGPSDRRAELIRLAKQEGGTVTCYGSTNLDEAGPIFDAFEEDTGISVNYYRAAPEDVTQRVVEEEKAGFLGTDVVTTIGPYMTLLERRGLFAPIDTPASKDITKDGVLDDWVWWYINTFTPGWNTKLISPQEAPRSWEDVLTNYSGELAMEAGDFAWFATLVEDYFVAKKGMTEEQAVKLFEHAARGARMVDGHTLMAELLAAGEFSVAASPYVHRIEQLKKQGAPLEWQPSVEPLVTEPAGVAIHAAAQHPASAMLLVDWLLTDAQSMLLDVDRQPASTAIPGGGLPTGYDYLLIDDDAVIDDYDKWSSLYEKVVQESGKGVIHD